MSRMDPEDARQGKKGTQVLVVLVAGLALALLVFAGLGVYGWALPDQNIPSSDVGGDTSAPATQPPANPSSGSTTVAPGAPAN